MSGSVESLAGRLLVAPPRLEEPTFRRTVVLVLAHTGEGALGVVLNRPGDAEVAEALPAWAALAAPPAVVFSGGPVQPEAAICLAEVAYVEDAPTGWSPLFGRLGTVDVSLGPDEVRPPVERVRLFAGYAGWDAGQLEDELEQDAWYVLDHEPADPLAERPADLWRTVLRRQGGQLAIVANYPPDLRVN